MTYEDLFQDLQDWTENPGSEFRGAIPRIIDNAEKRVYREVDLLATRKNISASIATAQNFIEIPSDSYYIRYLKWLSTDGTSNSLDKVDLGTLDEFYGDGADVGVPRLWAYSDSDFLRFSPKANADGLMTISYTFRPTSLSVDNPETWLSINAPNVLLYACLVEAGVFLKQRSNNNGEGMKKIYAEKYLEEIELLKIDEARRGNNIYRTGERI